MASRRRERISVPSWKRHFVEKYQTDLVIRINRILETKDWSQTDLKEEIGWSKARVSQVLSGDKNLTLKTIAKLEDALGEEILKVPLAEDREEKPMSDLLEVMHGRVFEETEHHQVAVRLRSLVLQYAGKERAQEESTENPEFSYSVHGSY